MREHRYHLLDVFTTRLFGGNQLAVFADARDVRPEDMSRIARELNLSETVFVLPPESPGATRRVRIFTPGGELPFAGHPTVGCACLLATLGVVALENGAGEIVLEEGVGNVPVRLRAGAPGEPMFAQLAAAQRPEIRKPSMGRDDLVAMLSLAGEDVLDGAAAVSCGVPFLFVPLRDRAAVARARLNLPVWERLAAPSWSPPVFIYALDPELPGSHVRARMFAPEMGIAEDPATGSAATGLAALLALRAGGDGVHRWRVEQGFEMGRPSILELEAVVEGGEVTSARVGGHAVLVGEGVLRLP